MNKELFHFGVKGQKWGIRRYQNEDGSLTSDGQKRYKKIDTLNSTKTKEQFHIGERKSRFSYQKNYDIFGQGQKLGDLWLESQGDNLYVNWIDIKKSHRGKGYANSVMDYVIKTAEKDGYKSITLEVPGNSPDARHIYDKHGFVETGKHEQADVWDGLTYMERKVRR